MNNLGSTSNADLLKRRNVGVNILVQYNFRIGRLQFRKLYKETLLKKKIRIPKDSRLITRDIEAIQEKIEAEYGKSIDWLDHKVDKPKNNSQFSEIGTTLGNTIRYLYLIIDNKEYLLYAKKPNVDKERISLTKFKKPVNEYIQLIEQHKKNKKDMLETKMPTDSSNDTEIESEAHYEYNPYLLAKFLFMYEEDDLTDKVANYYNEEGGANILYTSTHKFCTEIVTNMKFFNTVIEYAYYTVYP
ncbi:MAG: hypothetical protein Q4E61_04200 [Alphaproteobacteria bacterium]|nr:hypothetical protein [Alphaproteobacteria bacterium]